MSSKNVLNLTLDEIIRTKRGQGRNQTFETARVRSNWGANGRNQVKKFSNKSISSSLSSRLSLGKGKGGVGFKNVKGDLRKNITMQNRLGISMEPQRIPVHNRLTMSKNSQMQYFRPPVVVQTDSLNRKRNLKTKSSEDSQPVRITNGAIVKGLRSDQLLLQKLSQHKNLHLQNKMEKLRVLQFKRSQVAERSERNEMRLNPSKVSLNFNRGLTVSIANEAAKKTKDPTRPKKYAPPSSASSSSEESYSVPRPTRRLTEETKEQSLPSLLRLGLERPPPPKPHRQVLDSQIQKEISALQGFNEPHTGGPGPGVKGFKMLPSKTRHSLNERFTIERSVVE